MSTAVFFFGRLLHPDLRAAVLGEQVASEEGRLPGHVRQGAGNLAQGADLRVAPGGDVTGLVCDLMPRQLARLVCYMQAAGLQQRALEVLCGSGCVTACAFVPPDSGAERQEWCFEAWQALHAGPAVLAAQELLSSDAQHHSPEALRARYAMAHSHAGAQLRASAEPAPATLRGAWQRDDVRPERETRPYAWFFAVAEDDLRFRRFDGSWSSTVKRAGFVMSDAVTVLPYDPKRDVVMLIEQFRLGPWLRGARNCWSLEPVAGRIDAGESPVEAALREAQEEARLMLTEERLLPVANAYPSPGAVSEFLYQYVALCDLPDSAEGVAGLETEAEDIRSHVLSFDRLMDLVATGEAQNGPLVLSAFWLALNRARLRGC